MGVHLLVYVEAFASPQEAIAREKQLKNWRRDGKLS
jgi:putative endonuclease